MKAKALGVLGAATLLGLACKPSSTFAQTDASKDGGKPKLTVDCSAKPRPISPLIYGIAYDIQATKDTHPFELGATARRWGGNHTSRYNWKHGRAWNTAQDWYFRNVNYTDDDGYTYDRFLDENLKRGMSTALTVPMLGWVAKDTESVGFPSSVYAAQRGFDPYRKEAGDGFAPDGKHLASLPPSRTSVEAPPEFIAEWVKAIRKKDEKRGRSVHTYILDNEPMIWHETHRDVHPEPPTYAEVLDKSIRYGTAVRKADPQGLIAGPAEWGWTAYLYSAADMKLGTFARPDRRKNGDVPWVEWYLRKLREHEKKTGTRILDVFDLHYYPQGEGMGLGDSAKTDPASAARRLRSTRSLWDPTYKDESWIDEEIRLIPRMQEWVNANYPGLKLQLGEYNFGAEQHMSGGLAQAEALGRFGQHGLWAAYMWRYPPRNSPAYWAFRAYRNYDGNGAAFGDLSVPATSSLPNGVGPSIFAATDEKRSKLTLVLLNLDPSKPAAATLVPKGCGELGERRMFQYTGGEAGLRPVGAAGSELLLPPYSMTVVEYARTAKP